MGGVWAAISAASVGIAGFRYFARDMEVPVAAAIAARCIRAWLAWLSGELRVGGVRVVRRT